MLCHVNVNKVSSWVNKKSIWSGTVLTIHGVNFLVLPLGYSGPKCGIFTVTTVTTPAALKCTDCSTIGTEYCSLLNGALQCKCKTGKR